MSKVRTAPHEPPDSVNPVQTPNGSPVVRPCTVAGRTTNTRFDASEKNLRSAFRLERRLHDQYLGVEYTEGMKKTSSKRLTKFSVCPVGLILTYGVLKLTGQSFEGDLHVNRFNGSVSALYTDRRESCWFQRYADFHADAVRRSQEGQCVPSLIYVCDKLCGGVGDRMSGIMSAFYLAVVLDRAFFIEYKSPFPLTHTLVPKTVRWDHKHKSKRVCASTGFKETEIFMVDSKVPSKDLERIEALQRAGTPTIRLHINRYYVGIFLWSDPHQSTRTRSDGVAEYFKGKMTQYRSSQCGSTLAHDSSAAHTFSFAFTNLFHFAPNVKRRALEMLQELRLQDNSPFIAVHARIGGKMKRSNRVVGWIDPKRHDIEDVTKFFDCAEMKRQLLVEHTRDNAKDSLTTHVAPIVLFSDSDELKSSALVSARGVRTVHSTNVFHIDRSWSVFKRSMRKGNMDTFAELYVLSQASCIVGSNSTYSGLASSITFPPHPCFSYFDDCTNARWDFWTAT